jgi:neural Wiskott-Aldrich syndrome protein
MSQFAAALSWVPMSRNLAATMARACDYATQQAHRHVTLEHLLLALSDDADASAVMAVSNVDLGQLGADVAAHISQNGNRFTPADAIDPAADETLVRILDYAAAAARQSRRREINGAVVLAAIIGDGNSTAATILKAQGLTFEAAIRALQKSNAQPKAPVAPAEPMAVAPERTEWPENAPAQEPPTISGAATHANETMLANVRRKLEATRAAGPVRPTIAPIAPLASAPVPPPVPPSPQVEATPIAALEPVIDAVDESSGLATLAKAGSRPAPPASGSVEAAAVVQLSVASPVSPPTVAEVPPPQPPAIPHLAPVTMPVTEPVTAGADLARKHEGWLPPPSPTLVTEANKPARRTPPVPPVDTRGPPPLPSSPPSAQPATPVTALASEQARDQAYSLQERRGTHDAGPPRPNSRPPVPAPWPDSAPAAAYPPSAANPYLHGGQQPPHQTQLREFQPLPTGAVSGPHGGLSPYQQPLPPDYVGGRPNGAVPPGYPVPSPNPQSQPNGQRPPQPNQAGPRPPENGPNVAMPNVARSPQQRATSPVTITASVAKLTAPIPTKWRVSQDQVVEIHLSQDELRALAQQLDGRGAAYAHERVVAKAVSVRLRASDHSFAIDPTSPETLWLDTQTLQMSNDGAVWRWQATPQTSGRKKLQLVISARTVGGDGVVAETALPDQSVTVKVGGNRGRVVLQILGYVGLMLLGALIARYGEGGIETLMAWKRGFQ